MWKIVRIILVFGLLFSAPVPGFAECDQVDDGDCCKVDGDCRVFLHKALCVLLPLNQTASRELETQYRHLAKEERSQFCGEEKILELQLEAKKRRVVCQEEVCNFVEE